MAREPAHPTQGPPPRQRARMSSTLLPLGTSHAGPMSHATERRSASPPGARRCPASRPGSCPRTLLPQEAALQNQQPGPNKPIRCPPSSAHVDVQHLAPARVHAQLVHGGDLGEQACAGSRGVRTHAPINTRRGGPAPGWSGAAAAPAGAAGAAAHPERRRRPRRRRRRQRQGQAPRKASKQGQAARLLTNPSIHSRSSERKSRDMKRAETRVMTPPAVVRLKNSAASSRCTRAGAGGRRQARPGSS